MAAVGTTGAGLENHTVSVEKVMKGNYTGGKIGVITESQILEVSPKFKIGERAVLFLYQSPPLFCDKPFGSGFTTVNQLQGKYEIHNKGVVEGFDADINGMSMTDFEKKISDALESNDTDISNNTEPRNDTGTTLSNDTDATELLLYKYLTN